MQAGVREQEEQPTSWIVTPKPAPTNHPKPAGHPQTTSPNPPPTSRGEGRGGEREGGGATKWHSDVNRVMAGVQVGGGGGGQRPG